MSFDSRADGMAPTGIDGRSVELVGRLAISCGGLRSIEGGIADFEPQQTWFPIANKLINNIIIFELKHSTPIQMEPKPTGNKPPVRANSSSPEPGCVDTGVKQQQSPDEDAAIRNSKAFTESVQEEISDSNDALIGGAHSQVSAHKG